MNENTVEKIEPTPELIRNVKLIKTESGGWRHPQSPIERLAETGELGEGVKAGYRLEAAARFRNDYEAVYFVRLKCGVNDRDAPTPFDRLGGVRRILTGGDYAILEAVIVAEKDIDAIIAALPVLNKNEKTRDALVGRLCRVLDAVYECYSAF